MLKKFRLTEILLLIFVTVFCIINLQCGAYSFRGNNPPEGIKSLDIPIFEDVSGFSDATLKDNFTLKLKEIIVKDNTFLIGSRQTSDALLRCRITSVRDEALVISGNENVSKRRIIITVNVLFENLKTRKKIWEKQFENWGEYESSSNTFSDREIGIQSAINKISEDILIELTSNW